MYESISFKVTHRLHAQSLNADHAHLPPVVLIAAAASLLMADMFFTRWVKALPSRRLGYLFFSLTSALSSCQPLHLVRSYISTPYTRYSLCGPEFVEKQRANGRAQESTLCGPWYVGMIAVCIAVCRLMLMPVLQGTITVAYLLLSTTASIIGFLGVFKASACFHWVHHSC